MTTASSAETILRTRLRASTSTAYTTAEILQTLSYCQNVVNASRRRVIGHLEWTPTASTLLYTLRDNIPNALDLVSMENASGQTIRHIRNWKELAQYDKDWYTRTGTAHLAWTQIGRELFVLYPALTTPAVITVHYSRKCATLSTGGDLFELPDEDLNLVYDIAEIALLLRNRVYDIAKIKIKKLSDDLTLHTYAHGK